MKTLIYGYGNPGRQDDGIGARFTEKINKWIEENDITDVYTDTNYQLNIEDAAIIADYAKVIFVDASVVEDVDAYKLEEVVPNDATIEFTMHAVSTSFVLDLCQKIYGKTPLTYVLHIKAYEFDFKEELTDKAHENLNKAFHYLTEILLKG